MTEMPSSTQQVEVTRIRLGIVSAYLVRGVRTLLVDTGLPGQGERVLRALEDLGVASDLSAIVVTHLHADHAGNAKLLAGRLGVPILTPAGGIEYAEAGVNAPGTPTTWITSIVGRLGLVPNRFTPFQPDGVLRDGDRLDAFSVSATILATLGHTDHCISLVSDDGQAILGDVVRGGSRRHATPLEPLLLDDERAWRSSLDRLADAPWSTGHPGHGGPVPRAAFDGFVRRLRP